MKYTFTNQKLIINLILACVWTVVGLSRVTDKEETGYFKYLALILGIFYSAYFLYEFIRKYFEVTADKMTIFSLPEKEINLKDLVSVNYYADEYTFKTTDKTLKIVKSQIKESQRDEFDQFFNSLKEQVEQQKVTSIY